MRSNSLPPHLRQIALNSRLLATLPPEVQQLLLDAAQVIRLERGASLFHCGDTAHAIHIVAEGWVKLYRIAPNGIEAVVGVMTRGQSFGEPIALRRAAYPVSAEASTDCCLIAVPAQAMLDMLQTRPDVAISVLSAVFMHLQGLVEQIEQLKARNSCWNCARRASTAPK